MENYSAPFFLTRQSRRKLVKSDKIFIKDAKNVVTKDLNTFFSNAVKNLEIPECEEANHFAEKLSYSILKAISNIINTEASLLSVMLPMGERFNFHKLVLMTHLRKWKNSAPVTLRKKYPYLELCWSAFSSIWTEYGQILRISPYYNFYAM